MCPTFLQFSSCTAQLQERSSLPSVSWGWYCMTCGKCPIPRRVRFYTRSISPAWWNWSSWRRRIRLCSRHIRSWCVIFTSVSTSTMLDGSWMGWGHTIYFPFWIMPQRKFNFQYRMKISPAWWPPVDTEISSWMKMTPSMKKAISSRAFIARWANSCPGKLLIDLAEEICGSISSTWWNSIVGALPYCSARSQQTHWIASPWSTVFGEVSKSWGKLFAGHQLPREKRGKFNPATDLVQGWSCPIHIWYHG